MNNTSNAVISDANHRTAVWSLIFACLTFICVMLLYRSLNLYLRLATHTQQTRGRTETVPVKKHMYIPITMVMLSIFYLILFCVTYRGPGHWLVLCDYLVLSEYILFGLLKLIIIIYYAWRFLIVQKSSLGLRNQKLTFHYQIFISMLIFTFLITYSLSTWGIEPLDLGTQCSYNTTEDAGWAYFASMMVSFLSIFHCFLASGWP